MNIISGLMFYYLLSCLLIGLPMAIASVVLYQWGDYFDERGWKVTKIIRNFLHPLPYFFNTRDWWYSKISGEDNYRDLIGEIIDRRKPEPYQFLLYLVLASLGWPIKIFILATIAGIILGMWGSFVGLGICVFIAFGTYKILELFCKLVTWPLRKKPESIT